MSLRMVLPRYALTGIGSLPHTDPEAALAMAFAVDIPYLPQLEDARMVSSALTGSRAWVPFLREVERRRAPFAKIQIAGPAAVAEWGPTAAAPSLLAERPLWTRVEDGPGVRGRLRAVTRVGYCLPSLSSRSACNQSSW